MKKRLENITEKEIDISFKFMKLSRGTAKELRYEIFERFENGVLLKNNSGDKIKISTKGIFYKNYESGWVDISSVGPVGYLMNRGYEFDLITV